MKPKLMIIVSAAILVSAGVAWAYQSHQSQVKQAHDAAMERSADQKATATKTDEAAMKQDEAMAKKDGETMMVKGSFSDYDPAKLANAEKGKVVLFFSAAWCPVCREANKNFNASAAPDGLTLLKLDYDNSTELKKKYGVTYQHTYVQVDKDGKLLKKWSGSKTYAELEEQLKA